MDSVIKAIAIVAPVIIIALFAVPSFISTLRQRGVLFGLLIWLLLGVYVIAIETAAIKTGVPYGEFKFDSALGVQLFGATPWVLAIGYPPLILAAFWLSSKLTRSASRILLTGLFATLFDLVLDPAATQLEFWKWERSGPFYGVPLINFLGWLITASFAGWLLHLLWKAELPVLRGIAYSGMIIVLFWSGVNIGTEQWIPAAIGCSLAGLILLLAGLEKLKTSRETI